MQNGLYRVHFRTSLGEGAGVAVLKDGTLQGGDSSMYYRGTYSLSDDQATVQVTTGRHTSMPGIVSVFGLDNVHVNLTGSFTENSGTFKGSAREAPNVTFEARIALITPS